MIVHLFQTKTSTWDAYIAGKRLTADEKANDLESAVRECLGQ